MVQDCDLKAGPGKQKSKQKRSLLLLFEAREGRREGGREGGREEREKGREGGE